MLEDMELFTRQDRLDAVEQNSGTQEIGQLADFLKNVSTRCKYVRSFALQDHHQCEEEEPNDDRPHHQHGHCKLSFLCIPSSELVCHLHSAESTPPKAVS